MPGTQRSQILQANARLRHGLCPKKLEASARKTGFIQRQRVTDARGIFWALVTTLGSQNTQYLSDVLRTLNSQQGLSLRYKPFWNRLAKPAFPRFMQQTFQLLCSELVTRVVKDQLKGPSGFFSDIFIDDGSSFGLSDGLSDIFPGRFTKIRPAAVELHAHMSLFTDQVVSVQLAPDTRGEREFLPTPAQLPERSLSIRDRGYLDFGYFEELDETGAFLICRWRNNINSIVHKMHGVPRALARRYEGKPLKDVPKKHVLAASEITIIARHRQMRPPLLLRLIVRLLPASKRRRLKHPRKKQPKPRPSWLYLVTNLPKAKFSAEDVQRLYQLRWQIELVFKDWKSYANLHALQTENAAIAEGLIWAALCAAFIKRALAHCTQLVHCRAISTRIAAQLGPQIFQALTEWAAQNAAVHLLSRLLEYLAQNAARAHPNRDKKRPQKALGILLKV